MTPQDLNFAQECVRGAHTMLAALKRWAATKETTKQDEAFMRALDNAATASKEWLRAKAMTFAEQRSQEQQHPNPPEQPRV